MTNHARQVVAARLVAQIDSIIGPLSTKEKDEWFAYYKRELDIAEQELYQRKGKGVRSSKKTKGRGVYGTEDGRLP